MGRCFLSKFGSPLRPVQRLAINEQLCSSRVRSNGALFETIRLDVYDYTICAEYYAKALKTSKSRTPYAHLVKFILEQRCNMAAGSEMPAIPIYVFF